MERRICRRVCRRQTRGNAQNCAPDAFHEHVPGRNPQSDQFASQRNSLLAGSDVLVLEGHWRSHARAGWRHPDSLRESIRDTRGEPRDIPGEPGPVLRTGLPLRRMTGPSHEGHKKTARPWPLFTTGGDGRAVLLSSCLGLQADRTNFPDMARARTPCPRRGSAAPCPAGRPGHQRPRCCQCA